LGIAFAVHMVAAILLPNRNVIGWTMIIGFWGFFGLFPASFLAHHRFGRLLKRDDPGLAAQMGLVGLAQKINWNRSLASVQFETAEFEDRFFKRRSHREFVRRDLQFAAELYFWVKRVSIVLFSLLVASLPAAIVAVSVLRQHAP
jgi:hypothetical protein